MATSQVRGKLLQHFSPKSTGLTFVLVFAIPVRRKVIFKPYNFQYLNVFSRHCSSYIPMILVRRIYVSIKTCFVIIFCVRMAFMLNKHIFFGGGVDIWGLVTIGVRVKLRITQHACFQKLMKLSESCKIPGLFQLFVLPQLQISTGKKNKCSSIHFYRKIHCLTSAFHVKFHA